MPPFDTQTPSDLEGVRVLKERMEARGVVASLPPHIAKFRAELKPLPVREPIDFAAVRREADALYARGYGKGQAYAGLGDSIALANRVRLNGEDR